MAENRIPISQLLALLALHERDARTTQATCKLDYGESDKTVYGWAARLREIAEIRREILDLSAQYSSESIYERMHAALRYQKI